LLNARNMAETIIGHIKESGYALHTRSPQG
jgi:hypothetical protein